MTNEEIKETIEFLTNYNKWRRGDRDIEMPDPKEIGIHLDRTVDHLSESLNAEIFGIEDIEALKEENSKLIFTIDELCWKNKSLERRIDDKNVEIMRLKEIGKQVDNLHKECKDIYNKYNKERDRIEKVGIWFIGYVVASIFAIIYALSK